MTLDEIYSHFTHKMVQIELFHRAAQSLADAELKALGAYMDRLESASDETKELARTHALHNMLFHDVKTGQLLVFGHNRSSVEDKALSVLIHKNKQYQWLLAEAYEEFEDLIESIYAYCGINDPNFWPLADYGNNSLDDLKDKDFKWYLERASEKKNAPNSILNQFRKKLPELEKLERENGVKIDLRFVVVLIEKLRHIIVHRAGTVQDKQKFTERVLKDAGVQNHRNTDGLVSYISFFFGSGEYENTILMLEAPDRTMPIHAYTSRVGVLFDYLVGYGTLLYQLVGTHDRKVKEAT